VLVFRRQALSEDELADFSALFGPLERIVRTEWASPVRPEVGVISNLKDGQGKPIGGLGDGEIQWHSDQSYMLSPATAAMLYALELPPEGGMTSWVDLCAAYAGLPDRLKRAVAGRRALFDYAKRFAGYQGVDRVISEEAKRKTPPIVHPMVHAHPSPAQKRSTSIPRPPSGSKEWTRLQALFCSKRSMSSRRGRSSSIATTGRSVMPCYGTMASPCIAENPSTLRRVA
jgi:taurine dioxygenase